MKKQLVLTIIMFVAIMSFSATIAHSQAFKSADIQENTVIIKGLSYDNLSSNDDDKPKISWVLFSITAVFIVLRVFFKNIELNQTSITPLWITPVFYQSNYVVEAPCF
ncbi:hypothetical protein [Bacillus sinesaloumensis]|uniref:hypothetical protein n=1 Tax=Litchfieldia sinesaloumensis TaxID=1926280 RepID=UPI0009884C55|nr:hypothetical protein [Bacillus sinesaloumensis]